MSSLLGIVDYIVIGITLLISVGVGLFFRFTGGRQKTTDEFLMAGKSMSVGPVAFSIMATSMSAVVVLGTPAETYLYGTQHLTIAIGLFIGSFIVLYGVLTVFFDLEVSTAYEYLERRFGQVTRTISSLLFTLQMILHMAIVLYAPSLALNAVTGLSTWTSVIAIAAVCTFYSSLGGLKAVLWTDVFQALLMYVAVIAVVIKGSIDFGGIGKVFQTANEGGRIILFNMSPSLIERYTLLNTVIYGMLFFFINFGISQVQIQRMLSVGDTKRAQRALIWSLPLILIFKMLCAWDGVVLFSILHNCDPLQQPGEKLNSADQLLPYAILKMFLSIPGLSGLCIAGVFSASLSTMSSAINSLAAVTMEDFIRRFCFCERLTESWAAFLAKSIAIAYGFLCLLLTYIVSNFRGVYEASHVVNAMIGGPMLGIFLLGMFTTRANEPGTLIGLLIGITISAWICFGSYVAKIDIPKLPQSTEGCNAVVNDVIYSTSISNKTTTFELANMTEAFNLMDNEEEYVLPIYKVSFMWISFIGTSVVVIVGYLASYIIGIWKNYPFLNEIHFSPFVRKWYFNSLTRCSKTALCSEVELQSKSP